MDYSIITFAVNPDQKYCIDKMASEMGVDRSTFIRDKLLFDNKLFEEWKELNDYVALLKDMQDRSHKINNWFRDQISEMKRIRDHVEEGYKLAKLQPIIPGVGS